ncbi:MAG: hypothetical protein ACRERV_03380 [Methylococcales bacterium]
MTDAFFGINSALIAVLLAVIVLLALDRGYRFGLEKQVISHEPIKTQVITIQGSLLGLISLLLGFAFSVALHHFDKRSEAVRLEANAIGTTYLRAQSLPEAVRNETLTTLGRYVDVRVQSSQMSINNEALQEPLLREASQLRVKLWDLAMKSLEVDDRITTTGLYIQTLNHLIDSYGTRDETLNRHVPGLVLFLLLIIIILASGIFGYTSGVEGHRPTMAVMGLMVIFIIVLSMIMDLDRPRRGFIQVSQKNMLDLQEEIRSSP